MSTTIWLIIMVVSVSDQPTTYIEVEKKQDEFSYDPIKAIEVCQDIALTYNQIPELRAWCVEEISL